MRSVFRERGGGIAQCWQILISTIDLLSDVTRLIEESAIDTQHGLNTARDTVSLCNPSVFLDLLCQLLIFFTASDSENLTCL